MKRLTSIRRGARKCARISHACDSIVSMLCHNFVTAGSLICCPTVHVVLQMTELLLDLNDEALVAGFKVTKSPQYFKMLVTRHQQRLYNTTFRILECPDLAEEAVQETFIKALRSIDRFKTNASLSAWLYAIAHNICIDMLRGRQKKRHFQNSSFDPQSVLKNDSPYKKTRHVVNQLADRLPGPAEQAELSEQMKIVSTSLSEIPDKQRLVMILHDVEGLSYEDIASVTGISIGTVRSRLHYGRSKLKKILRPYL